LNNIHGTLISFQNKGILFIGPSGAGKSDLALRFVVEKKSLLVADDQVIISLKNGYLYGSAPKTIFGKIEARGIGIVDVETKEEEKIVLCVELVSSPDDIERFPKPEHIDFLGISVPKIRLYAFECSTVCKIILKICSIIS